MRPTISDICPPPPMKKGWKPGGREGDSSLLVLAPEWDGRQKKKRPHSCDHTVKWTNRTSSPALRRERAQKSPLSCIGVLFPPDPNLRISGNPDVAANLRVTLIVWRETQKIEAKAMQALGKKPPAGFHKGRN